MTLVFMFGVHVHVRVSKILHGNLGQNNSENLTQQRNFWNNLPFQNYETLRLRLLEQTYFTKNDGPVPIYDSIRFLGVITPHGWNVVLPFLAALLPV